MVLVVTDRSIAGRSERDCIQRPLNLVLRPSCRRARWSVTGNIGALARLIQYDRSAVVCHFQRAIKDKNAVIAVERAGPKIGAPDAQDRYVCVDFNNAVGGLGKPARREAERAASEKLEAIGNTRFSEHKLINFEFGVLAKRQDRSVIELHDQPGACARRHDIEEVDRRGDLQRPFLAFGLDIADPPYTQDLTNSFGGKGRVWKAENQNHKTNESD